MLDLILGIDATGGECRSDGALGDNPLLEVLKCGGLHLVVTEDVPIGGGETKKEFLCCSVSEWGTKNGLELSVACLSMSMMFSAVKSWNFVGLICLLLAGRCFKNC